MHTLYHGTLRKDKCPRVTLPSRLPAVVPDKSLGTWHLAQYVREGQRLGMYITMIIYFVYVRFRDYEYLCWVKLGTNLSYEYDHA